MRKNYRMKNIFADKASLVLRKMLQNPERKWLVRDFTGPGGVSVGMSQEVLEAMEKKGYIERIKKGPNSYAILTNKEKLISDWLEEYNFDQMESIPEFDNVYRVVRRKLRQAGLLG